ncbi:hypothetical protein CCMSSC00406_0008243 [Pleurotus cornucopiae]|uniref:Uncharacterized protein n=1 Tax=Pleurotus cornucopiae TaxID=5321 RepID=A0ACB7INM1_PLECO|nr:hypothetical protein CCMSSC00406_0008243 [Pleurotus cornucopiae]
MATLPEGHPLYQHVQRASKHDVKWHRTPLHALMNDFEPDICGVETVKATRWDATWRSRLNTVIAGSRIEAVRAESSDRTRIKVYMDGSGYKGQVGAAAVMTKNGATTGVLKMRLGTEKDCTVYNGECAALVLGMELIRRQTGIESASIYVDNQAAIIGMGSRKANPGSYLLDHAHTVFAAAWRRNAGIKLMIHWIPGHEGVEGNERADKAAREAVEGWVSKKSSLPAPLREKDAIKRSKAAAIQAYKVKLKKRARKGWKLSERYGRMVELGLGRTSMGHKKAVASMT